MILTRFRALLGDLGLGDTVLYLVARGIAAVARRPVLIKYYLYAQPLPDKPLFGARPSASHQIRRVEPGDPLTASFPRPEDVIADRFEQGAICLALEREGALKGYIWFILGDYNEDEVWCTFRPLPAGVAAWDFDVYVDPADRLGLAFARLWEAGRQYLRERGYTWSISRVSAFNSASLRAHRRLQAKPVGSMVILLLGAYQMMWSTGLRRPAFVRTGDVRPLVEVKAPSW